MTIDLPRESAFNAPSKAVDRRQLLKAGVWAAPVLVLTTASPAMAASGPVPVDQLTVVSKSLTSSGALGPLSWAGGTIKWVRSGTGEPTIARVSYTAILAGPNGFSKTLVPATATLIQDGATLTIDGVADTTTGLTPGLYTVTLMASSGTGAGTSTSALSSVTLVAPTVPVNQLAVTANALSVVVGAAPLSWAGGRIVWNAPTGSPAYASVSYTVVLSGPAGFTPLTLHTGATSLAPGGVIDFPAGTYGTVAAPAGNYQVTITATSATSVPVVSNIATLVKAVTVTALTGTASGSGNGRTYALSFTVSNIGPVPVTVSVGLSGTGLFTQPNPANVTDLVVPAGGSVTRPVGTPGITAVTDNNGTGKTMTATITAPAGWTVNNLTKTFKGDQSF